MLLSAVDGRKIIIEIKDTELGKLREKKVFKPIRKQNNVIRCAEMVTWHDQGVVLLEV